MADIVTAEHKQRALGAELDEMAANTSRQRPRGINSLKSISVTHAAAAKVNPFSERDIDVARQNYLAQEASVKSSAAEQNRSRASWIARCWVNILKSPA